jgi:hypothetical protein
MSLYERPRHYAVSHMLFGFLAAWFPIIGLLAVVYQLGQLFFNVRVFPVEGKILSGNSVQHTGLKLAEMLLGYSIGSLVRTL